MAGSACALLNAENGLSLRSYHFQSLQPLKDSLLLLVSCCKRLEQIWVWANGHLFKQHLLLLLLHLPSLQRVLWQWPWNEKQSSNEEDIMNIITILAISLTIYHVYIKKVFRRLSQSPRCSLTAARRWQYHEVVPTSKYSSCQLLVYDT